jgi:hypothetical protein
VSFEREHRNREQDLVYSTKVRAGKRRTYFFDVRRTKGDDYFLSITESTKRLNSDSYERHKILLYKEDFNRFVKELEGVLEYVKTELMPNYDYDEYERRQLEWEERRANGEFDLPKVADDDAPKNATESTENESHEDEISW